MGVRCKAPGDTLHDVGLKFNIPPTFNQTCELLPQVQQVQNIIIDLMTDIVGNSLSEVLTGNYEVKVQNYSKIDKTVGYSIWSPTFHLLGRQWKLEIYPGGATQEAKEYISMFLEYEQGISEVTASVAFTLIDQVNKNPHSITRTMSESTFALNGFTDSGWGFEQFVKRRLLTDENFGFIVDDAAIFRVEIKVTNTAGTSDLETIAAAESKAEPSLTYLFKSGMGSDVSVVILDEASQLVSSRIPVHKCILMVKSPVFKAMFTHNMSESNTNEIVISDFSPEVIRKMLHFMYTDKLQSGTLDNTVYEGLLRAAIKYDVSDLVKLCEVHFAAQLTDSRVIDLVRLANVSSSEALKQKCVCYVQNNTERLVKGLNSKAFLGSALDALVSANFEVGRKRKASDDCDNNDTASDDGNDGSGSTVSDNNECVVM